MGRSSIPPALVELRNPTSPEAQVQALRDLKNEIVGHDQRKELAVTHGVVAPLVRILRTEARKGGKRRSRVLNGNAGGSGTSARAGIRDDERRTAPEEQEWSTEDEMRLQATLVVGSLALGGPAFVAPLLAGNILPPLLEALSPSEVPPKLIVSALRTLILIADAITLDKPWTETIDGPLRLTPAYSIPGQIYAKPVVDSFAEILAQSSASANVHQQISLTAQLIFKTCKEDHQQRMLLNAGILELLASKLATIASSGDSSLRAVGSESRPFSRDALPSIYLADILQAIGAIIQNSYYRTARFLYSPSVISVFPVTKVEGNTSSYEGYSTSQGVTQGTSFDRLLPRLQAVQSKTETSFSKAFPALGAFQLGTFGGDFPRMQSLDPHLQPSSRIITADEFESPLFTWLIHVARRGQAFDRLAATWLLGLLKVFSEKYAPDESTKNRERTLAFLIVPLLVNMIQEANQPFDASKKSTIANNQARVDNRILLEQAPAVLAALMGQSVALHKAAVEAKAVPLLCSILKKSFDPVPSSSKPLWSPRPPSPILQHDPTIDLASSTLGRPGLSSETLHALKCREGALKALASIADKEDSYRKLIIENNAVACITESLQPYPERPVDESNRQSSGTQNGASTTTKDGNPVHVLIAACHTARAMSRSVSILRTSLIDHGIAKPILVLLKHPDIDVQIAATEVLCNLVLHFSPMRDDLLAAGSLKMLCERAHSANPAMRLISLWALKHMVLTAPNDIKIKCLDELGTGWLVQAITGELRDFSMPQKERSQVSTPIGMGTPNAAGEQVDLLNAVDEPNMQIDDVTSSSDEEDDDTMVDDIGSLRHSRPLRFSTASQIRSRLKAIKDEEQDPRIRAEHDDIRNQEQALDFIRNLLADSTTKTGACEMIDHLLNTIGTSRFFDILDSKLRPKGTGTRSQLHFPPSISTPSRMRSPLPGSANQGQIQNLSFGNIPYTTYAPFEILISSVFILVHIANGRPSHRSLIISQTALLSHVLPLFQHPHHKMRTACVWLINNLTWIEDANDALNARERAQQLRNLGIEERVKSLTQDPDLDCKERAKTAVEQMGKLLEGVNLGMGMSGDRKSVV